MTQQTKHFAIRLFCLLLAVSVSASAQTAARPSPISHESMWMMRRVGAPVVSPDGKWVVVSVTEPAYDDKDQVTDLWIAPADGSGKPRRLTSTKGGESGVNWNPDGRRIAFSARRDGDEASQIYVLDVTGGEAARVTSLSTGARSPRWRPDGAALHFTSSVYPGAADDEANRKAAAERRARKYRARVYDSFPIRYWDRWLDDTQPHLFVQTLEPNAKARDLLAGSRLVAMKGFGGLQGNAADELNAVWTPDGSAVVFVATTNRDAAAYSDTNTHLFTVPAAGGEPKQLTSGSDSYNNPVFRPDGKALYCTVTTENEETYNLTRLALLRPGQEGAPVVVTKTFDRSVGGFAFTPDSRTVYLLAEDAGIVTL